jgi:hypothetical protein
VSDQGLILDNLQIVIVSDSEGGKKGMRGDISHVRRYPLAAYSIAHWEESTGG